MKLQTLFKGSLALLSMCLLATTGHATTASGDLMLDFTSDSGQGSGFDLEVDLGPYSKFITGGVDATGAVINLTSFLSLSDLSSTGASGGFGANWATDGLVEWSVVGTSNSSSSGLPKFTLLGTVNNGVPLTPSSSFNTPSGSINSFVLGAAASQPTSNSASSGFDAISDQASYSFVSSADTDTPNFFNYFGSSFESTISGGSSTAALYYIEPGISQTAVDVGNFKIGSTGLTFQSTAAVPEPSTWASLVVGIAILFGVSRRRRMAA